MDGCSMGVLELGIGWCWGFRVTSQFSAFMEFDGALNLIFC